MNHPTMSGGNFAVYKAKNFFNFLRLAMAFALENKISVLKASTNYSSSKMMKLIDYFEIVCPDGLKGCARVNEGEYLSSLKILIHSTSIEGSGKLFNLRMQYWNEIGFEDWEENRQWKEFLELAGKDFENYEEVFEKYEWGKTERSV